MKKPTAYAIMLMKKLNKLHVYIKKEWAARYKHLDIVIPKAKIDNEVDIYKHVTNSTQTPNNFKKSQSGEVKKQDTIHVINDDVYKNSGGISSAIAEACAVRDEKLKAK